MKKVFLVLFSILLLFSCATGKELERVETIVEKVEEKDVIEEVETESVPFTSIEEEEEEEDLDPDAGKSQQQVIDAMTGQLNLFTDGNGNEVLK